MISQWVTVWLIMLSLDANFKKVNKEVQLLVAKFPPRSASFMPIPHHFTFRGTQHCKVHLYKIKRGRPDVHLNRQGAKLYAKVLFDHLHHIPKKAWSMSPIDPPQWIVYSYFHFFPHFFPPNINFLSHFFLHHFFLHYSIFYQLYVFPTIIWIDCDNFPSSKIFKLNIVFIIFTFYSRLTLISFSGFSGLVVITGVISVIYR